MNGKFIIALTVAIILMSCSESNTTAPEEQKMYVFESTDSVAANVELRPTEMSKDGNGIWQASIIVPSTPVSIGKNFYFVLIGDNMEIRDGTTIYGDTLIQTGIWRATRPDTIAFPFSDKLLKGYSIGRMIPTRKLLPTKVMRIPRPDTLNISFNPNNYALSVQ
jgi:hypothetical protein